MLVLYSDAAYLVNTKTGKYQAHNGATWGASWDKVRACCATGCGRAAAVYPDAMCGGINADQSKGPLDLGANKKATNWSGTKAIGRIAGDEVLLMYDSGVYRVGPAPDVCRPPRA